MKAFVVVLAAVCFVGAFGALTPEDQTKLATVKESCIKSSAVEPAKVLAAKEGKWEESDMNLRKFASCFLTELGMMKGGSLDVEVTRTKIAKVVAADKIDEIMNKCKDMKGADADETALKLLKCYTDNRAVAA